MKAIAGAKSAIAAVIASAVIMSGCVAPDYGPSDASTDNHWLYRASVDLPVFPWPPPRASAMITLPGRAVTNALGVEQTFGNAEALIFQALDLGGYCDRSTWLVPGGFAVVTRLERIKLDGAPVAEPDRWPLPETGATRFNLMRFVYRLFYAEPGYFRVIVFVVSDEAFTQTDRSPTRDEAFEWLQKGANRLPREYAERTFTRLHAVTALIYEFARENASDKARLLRPGRLTGRKHLEMAGLYAVLLSRQVDGK